MSLTREIVSITPISPKKALQLRLSVKSIDPMNLTDEDSLFLGLFLKQCVSRGQYYIQSGPWEVRSTGADGVKQHDCVHLAAPILLRHSGAYITHLRAEVMGSEIGSGSYGKVYKALGTLLLQPDNGVTVKSCSRIIKEQSHRGTMIKDVERESELGIQAGYLHMKMPVHADQASFTVSRYFADTVELFDVIDDLYTRNDRYSTDMILRIILNLLFAVKSQLHDRGIISRDIKPENILVRLATEEVFNIDLGLASLIGECNDNEFVGSYGYLTPEVFSKTGMTVKSDIFSLGVTISLLLGARHGDNLLNMADKGAASFPNMDKLFTHVSDLSAQDKASLSEMLQSMMAVKPDDRISIEKAITLVEGIILQRHLAKMPVDIHAALNQAYALAVMIRDDLDLAQTAMDAYFSMDPFVAMDALVKQLTHKIVNELNKLPDRPEAIKVFAETVSSKRIAALTTRAAILEMVKADCKEYESKKLSLEIARREVSTRLGEAAEVKGLARDKIEALELARQEQGLMVTALAYRIRSIAPTIDNLPLLMRKLDKSIAEFQRLGRYVSEGLPMVGTGGQYLPVMGLFSPSSSRLPGDQPGLSIPDCGSARRQSC